MMNNDGRSGGCQLSAAGSASESAVDNVGTRLTDVAFCQVTRGAIKVGGLSVPLGIKGEGRQRVMYVDDNLRIFQSLADTPGGWEEKDLLVVQIPEKELSLVGV
jgi:hypothetical protein